MKKKVERNFEHLKQKLNAHNSFQNLVAIRDDQMFRYSIDFYDSMLSLLKTIFVVTLGGYITSLSLKDITFLDVSYLRFILLRTILVSVLMGFIIFIIRFYEINKIMKIINERIKTLWELCKLENNIADNLHQSKEKIEEFNHRFNTIEKIEIK